ncbi:hypothetical protein [Chitinophaga polysaccharea]|uniref:hypothetical protein n=1 Tax=Chitinophaga polysaccharea TaxID=1293035 RepID=UPI00115AF430|nr:hypothetical protein [Chitinophaga polysaccharea]
MRSFVALMTCIGCIAWIHSCEKRLLGVRLEKKNILIDQPEQLPLAVVPAGIPPARYISQVIPASNTKVVPANRNRNRLKVKKQVPNNNGAIDSLLFNQVFVRGKYTIYSNPNP